MGMTRTVLLLMSVAVAMMVAVAGCSGTPDKNVARKNAKEKPKTVVVNKGMSKKQEEELNKRLDKLEKKVDSQDEKASEGTASQPTESSQPEQSQAPQAEDEARVAAEAYYQAVAARDWGYTYDHLDSETQSAFTEEEWFAKNDYLADTGPVTYTIQSVVMDSAYPETVANVAVLLTTTDGSTSVRNTYFIYEDGSWLHRFSPEEYDLLASAPTGTSSASSSASVSASATASATASSSSSLSPNPSPNPSPNRNHNRRQPNVPGNAHSSSGGGDLCPQGGHWVGIDGPGDGDSDGCAGE
jgi:hypothetical protein